MRSYVKEGQLNLEQLQTEYITFGSGKKTLIMIQGLNTRGIKGSGFALAWLYRIFARDYKVYLFDRRKNIGQNVTVRELASDIAMAMDALKITNADVFGVSQGGMIAQYLAIDRPDLVHKLVLAVTLSRNNDTVRETICRWVKLTENGRMKELVTDMAECMYSDAYIKRYRPFLPLLTVLQKPGDVQRFITLAKACLTCDVYEQLTQIHCPVFVIGGKQDRVIGSRACEEIAEKLACELYMYDHLGHAAYEEAKDFNQRVYGFLKR